MPPRPATLCFIQDGEELLLIQKKRGIGEGLYNGPGGKLEDGETPRECAIRETEEELGITPENVEKRGETRFIFGDEPFMHVHIFTAEGYTGEPVETEEAAPHRVHVDDIPYDEMWPDDRHWLPILLAGDQFHGTFHFDADGDELLEHDLVRGDHRHPDREHR